jgi:hypothetical protein
MFEPSSRYASLRNLTLTLPDGREVVYKERRFLPQGEELPAQGSVTVRHGDRLDLVAARAIGDPLLFWRLCDAGNVMNPLVDTCVPGRVFRVPRPQP